MCLLAYLVLYCGLQHISISRDDGLQELERGQQLVLLPKRCQLTYDDESTPELLALIEQVPHELWGARLALQVCTPSEAAIWHGVMSVIICHSHARTLHSLQIQT